jgi:hypothetical protein
LIIGGIENDSLFWKNLTKALDTRKEKMPPFYEEND